ncbi:uncharacterized protein LOC127162064 isoform X1 [Labeo rohita]|uniref:uncharacterized protein LOC127162064 isoform X1 n=1 Tax=Labeo rohita TaxID=84645 RepID=UPI0021E28E13|nr:uncharacterized protein LOC127162064 isoform X1 [Labeo rohita]
MQRVRAFAVSGSNWGGKQLCTNRNPSVCQCWMMEMMESSVNVTCAEIQISDGFEFRVPADRFTHFHQSDCEQLWYSQDGRLIADPSDPQRMIDPATAVKSDRLFTSYCVNLNHQIICDSTTHFSREIMFRVRNQTAVTPNSDVVNEVTPDRQHSDHFWWLLAVFIIVLLIIILICLMKRKRIFRCFQRLICQHEDDDSKNRNPEAAVQVELRSDAPDSLNQSELEQLNGSLS